MASQYGFPDMSLADYYNEIENQYNQQSGYLNQVEQQVRGEQPGNLQAIENDFQTVLRQLSSGKTATASQLSENATTAGQRKEDAQAAARRLYAELQRGYRQRFGGASSANEAANTLAGVEQQRQMGQNQRDYSNTMRQIETQKAQVEQDYQSSLLNLEQQKQEAIRVANNEFQQKLLEITRNRTEIGANKAQQRLAALQELRNQVFAVQAQAQQFQQQLQMMKYQSDLELQNYTKQLSLAGQSGQSALGAFQPSAQSNLQLGAGQSGQNAPLYGIMYGNNKDEQYTGAIVPSANTKDYLRNYGTYGYKPVVG